MPQRIDYIAVADNQGVNQIIAGVNASGKFEIFPFPKGTLIGDESLGCNEVSRVALRAAFFDAKATGEIQRCWVRYDLPDRSGSCKVNMVPMGDGGVVMLVEAYPDCHKEEEERITDKDAELLKLLADGHTTDQIAKEWCVRVDSVHKARSRLLQRTDCRTIEECIAWAFRHKLIA